LRRLGVTVCPEYSTAPHRFGSPDELRDILEHAADELERLQTLEQIAEKTADLASAFREDVK
jgi:hypothetical protein